MTNVTQQESRRNWNIRKVINTTRLFQRASDQGARIAFSIYAAGQVTGAGALMAYVARLEASQGGHAGARTREK